jgi:hypothetical protein
MSANAMGASRVIVHVSCRVDGAMMAWNPRTWCSRPLPRQPQSGGGWRYRRALRGGAEATSAAMGDSVRIRKNQHVRPFGNSVIVNCADPLRILLNMLSACVSEMTQRVGRPQGQTNAGVTTDAQMRLDPRFTIHDREDSADFMRLP